MTEKTRIVAHLEARGLMLPGLVHEALAANDRLKAALTLLQDACAAAECSTGGEPRAGAVPTAGDDTPGMLARACRVEGGYRLPGVGALVEDMRADLRWMLRPLTAQGAAQAFEARLEALERRLPELVDDLAPRGFVAALASAQRERADSLHLLLMDVHRALNRLAAGLAEETVDGAQAFAIEPDDRQRIAAFISLRGKPRPSGREGIARRPPGAFLFPLSFLHG